LDGRQGLPTMEDMAAAHIKSMRAVQPDGPYLLGGWCNGGLVAYEIARQLRTEGQAIDLLVLLDPVFLVYPVSYRLYRAAFNQLGKLLRVSQDNELNWYLCLKYLSRSLRYKLLRKKDPDHLTFRDLRQNYPRLFDWIASGYRPPNLYDGKITFFWSRVTYEIKARLKGWHKVEANGEIEVHIIPGDHITSRTDYLHVLADHLHSCIRKAQTSASK
jgi:thioesterase domain-containing protein